MEQLRQTQATMNDLFVRLATKAALDRTTQRYAERDAQSRELLSAMGDFAEKQRRAQDDVRGLLEKRNDSDRMLEENMARMFKEKRETDEKIGREIEEVFNESVRGAQEIEELLRRLDVAMPPVDISEAPGQAQPASEEPRRSPSISSVPSSPSSFSDMSNPFTNLLASPTLQSFESADKVSVSLTPLDNPKLPVSSLLPSPPPHIPEMKPEPQEWNFFDYDKDVFWGSAGQPLIKPPSSLTEFCEPEVAIPSDSLRLESVHDNVEIPIPTWTENRIQEIQVNGIRILQIGGPELSVRIVDSAKGPSALEELTQNLTKYHRGTLHKLESNCPVSAFVAVQSSHGKAWHRGKIVRFNRNHYHDTIYGVEVCFIDLGFHENVCLDNIRPLPTLFRHLPQQALKARLSFVELVEPSNQHYTEALETLQRACAGRKLMAKLDYNHHGTLHIRLMNPGDKPDNISASINVQLLQRGLAVLSDSSQYSYTYADRAISQLLATIVINARDEGVGIYRRKDTAL